MKAKSKQTNAARGTPARRGGRGQANVKGTAIPRKWSWHFRTLLALRDRLAGDAQRRRRDVADAIEPHSMHVADSATDEFDHDLLLGLLGREAGALGEIEAALERLVAGRYGVCEETGEPIPAARLRAVPWCRFCREAEERLERQGVVAKFRLPGPGSIGTARPTLPGTGKVPPESLMEGEEEEPVNQEISTEAGEPAGEGGGEPSPKP